MLVVQIQRVIGIKGFTVLYSIERTILMVTATLAGTGILLIWMKQVPLEFQPFVMPVSFGLLFLFAGQLYRTIRSNEQIGLMCTSIGLFILFSISGAVYNAALLPLPFPPQDASLVAIDGWFGYSWPVWSAHLAQFPILADLLRGIYILALPGLQMVLVYLSLQRDRRSVHVLALTCVIATVSTISIWVFFPTAGPGGYWVLAPEIHAALQPIADSSYGAKLNRMFAFGIRDFSDFKTIGLIGFPSFHIVMGFAPLLVIWPKKALRLPFLAFFILLIPATLIHGAHHLMDIVGGIANAVIAFWIAQKTYDHLESEQKNLSKAHQPVEIPAG